MRFRSLALASSLAVLASGSAYAQTTSTVKVTAPAVGTAVTSGDAAAGSYPAGTPNFYVSPYAGLIDYNASTNSGQSVRLNCIDYFHHVNIGDVWTVNVTNIGAAASNIGLLSSTRYGSGATTADRYNVLELYKQAAWLTLQYDANPGLTPDKTRAIQSAIWGLFNSRTPEGVEPPFNGPGVTVNDSQWWIDQAQLASNRLADSQLQYFSILSDNTFPNAADSKQEFLVYTTPEPGTIILMLSGFAVVAVMVRRRRSAPAVLDLA